MMPVWNALKDMKKEIKFHVILEVTSDFKFCVHFFSYVHFLKVKLG
jgi:hypothetical protein